MPEPQELSKARRCLARAEADLSSADGLAQLVEGLAFLDDVIGSGTAAATTARNLAMTYAARIYALSPATSSCPSPSSSIFSRSCSRLTRSALRCPSRRKSSRSKSRGA